jgi:hypothetical protein
VCRTKARMKPEYRVELLDQMLAEFEQFLVSG